MISLAFIGVGLGIGLVIIGAAIGIGRIGDSAAQGISRQPEASGSITVAMIISAALIEGAALFALVIAFTMGGVLDKETVSEFAKANKPVVEQQDQ
ncbi:MAG: F0F1 ATP synthase subunit C [Spirochaetaceae bacterium]|nr:F0F1 ATP synthase subunit C [Spirochaetaceae bacterium]|tara:strand:- start:76660 stop:76947 length:288 start_codon:yes stop_codon:yes gene_type:complete